MTVPGAITRPRPPRPYCRWCQQVIHRDDTAPLGWRHSGTARATCRDVEHYAAPREA